MPLITGGDLFNYIVKSSKLYVEEAKYISYQVSSVRVLASSTRSQLKICDAT